MFVKKRIASSTLLFDLYANWYGSKEFSKKGSILAKTIFSKHFMTTGVRATGLRSFICFIQLDLGQGIILEVFQERGILQVLIEILNIVQ